MRTSRIVDNRTPLTAKCVPINDSAGREVLSVVAKATWEIGDDGRLRLALDPAPIRMHDEPRKDEGGVATPGASARFPSDLGERRPGTGINPNDAGRLLGRAARRDLAADTLLSEDDVVRAPSQVERAA